MAVLLASLYLPCHASAMPALDFAGLRRNDPDGVALGKRLTCLDFPVNHTYISILIRKDAFDFSRVEMVVRIQAAICLERLS